MSTPRFRQINADIPDSAIDKINDSLQVPKLLRSEPATVAPARHRHVESSRRISVDLSPTSGALPDGQHKLTLRIPQSLNDTLKRDALEHRSYVRAIILCALQLRGYHVPAQELIEPDALARLRAAILSRHKSVEAPSVQIRPSPQQKITLDVPSSLELALKQDGLKRDASNRRASVRRIILQALRAFGYPVADADLEPGAGGNC